jgi:hypothetical protein
MDTGPSPKPRALPATSIRSWGSTHRHRERHRSTSLRRRTGLRKASRSSHTDPYTPTGPRPWPAPALPQQVAEPEAAPGPGPELAVLAAVAAAQEAACPAPAWLAAPLAAQRQGLEPGSSKPRQRSHPGLELRRTPRARNTKRQSAWSSWHHPKYETIVCLLLFYNISCDSR